MYVGLEICPTVLYIPNFGNKLKSVDAAAALCLVPIVGSMRLNGAQIQYGRGTLAPTV
jgi:hypothetical protein